MLRLSRGETFGDVLGAPPRHAAVTLSLHASGGSTGWHCHASTYVCAVVGGKLLHRDRRSEFEGQCGSLIAIAADEPHCDRFGAEGALCINLFLNDDALSARPALSSASTRVRDLLAETAGELALGTAGDPLALESLSAELLSQMGADQGEACDDAAVLMVIEAIEHAPEYAWTLSELATIARRHPASLARAFRHRTGRTIGAWRRRLRLTRLCLDLSATETPLAALAQRHGFSDQAHMSRTFRAFAGASPGAFRRDSGRCKSRRG